MGAETGDLEGYRVLDLTGEAGFFAGKLLGDLGADVIKIEPLGGEPARQRGPFLLGAADRERGILWLSLNTSKRGITLDIASARGRELFLQLCDTADAVIESPLQPTQSLGASGLGYEKLRERNRRIVFCSLTPFGRSGPRAEYRGSDLTSVASGGNMYPTGNPDRAPVRCTLPVAHYHGGVEAAVGVVFALWGRELTGEGQLVDVSLQEAMVMPNMTVPAQLPLTGFKGARIGGGFRGGLAKFQELWPCKDGWVSFALRGGPARIPGIVALVRFMDESGVAPEHLKKRDWAAYNHNTISQAEVDEIEAALGAFFLTRTMKELFETACERKLMLAPAYTAREIVGSSQLAAREFFVEIEPPGLGTALRYPGAFARTSRKGVGIRRPAPRVGQHNAEVYTSLGLDAEARAALAREGVI